MSLDSRQTGSAGGVGLFESLRAEFADRLDEARKASATGRMRDQDGTNVIALPAAVGEQGH
jgi:hypothetical protein